MKIYTKDEVKMVLAKRHLVDFIEMDGYPRWLRAPHLELLCSKLEKVERAVQGKNKFNRLIVNMPPRHGKSEVVSKKFPAWFLGRNPDEEVILATYAAELAQDHSGIARDTFAEWGQKLWGLKLDERSQARNRWRIAKHRGGLTAAGVGGAITGRGASLLIIDDPIKDAEEAMSRVIEDKVWNWWQSTAYTRLSPTGAVVIVMTRWSQDDLAGRLLDRMGENRDDWTVLSLPAICENPDRDLIGRKMGEALWPDRYPIDRLEDFKNDSKVGPFWFQAMYQQVPLDIAAQVFTTTNMHTLDPAKINLHECVFYGACDPSEGGDDFCAITTIAVAKQEHGTVWLVWDCDMKNDNQSITIDKILKYHRLYNYRKFVIEANSLGHAKSADGLSIFEIEMRRRMLNSGITVPYELIYNTSAKDFRIRSIEPYYSNGQLSFRSDYNKAYQELIFQLHRFPTARHDDGPDALEMCINCIVRDLRKMRAYKLPQALVQRPVDPMTAGVKFPPNSLIITNPF